MGGMAGGVVRGQRVAPVKVERARELRRRMTPSERLLWSWLRSGRVGGWRFRRQQVIDGFVADFYCHAAGLVVEVGGAPHAEQGEYDAERDRVFAGRGIRVLRVGSNEVMTDLRRVVA